MCFTIYLTPYTIHRFLFWYGLEETAIAFYGRYTFLRYKQNHVLLPGLWVIFEERGVLTGFYSSMSPVFVTIAYP